MLNFIPFLANYADSDSAVQSQECWLVKLRRQVIKLFCAGRSMFLMLTMGVPVCPSELCRFLSPSEKEVEDACREEPPSLLLCGLSTVSMPGSVNWVKAYRSLQVRRGAGRTLYLRAHSIFGSTVEPSTVTSLGQLKKEKGVL